jgi:magnesium-protoporphyrin IX monomethyl ester (oxidative) cyclase
MRVLLVNPRQTFYPGSDLPAGNLPLGLLYLAAVLETAGHEVSILDEFMSSSSSIWKSNEKTIIGMPNWKIKEELRKTNPHVVGVSNPFTSQVENAISICNIVKAANPQILTVVGGPHVSAVPLQFLEEAKNADIAVVGEGEQTLLDIVTSLERQQAISTVLGIAYRRGAEVLRTPPRPLLQNLDELPFPAYHLVDMEQYLKPRGIGYRSFKDRSISMITSRGCPFNCCFCSVHLHMGKPFRAHSAAYVVKHVEYVVKKYRVKTIFFEDDNLTLDTDRFEAICDKIIAQGIKVNWETPDGVRADCLTPQLLRKMKQSGCTSLFFGIESGDQKVLDNVIGKSLDLKKVIDVAKTCEELELKTGAFYIIGFPGEKKENMLKTVEFALRLRVDYNVGMHLFVATPSIGTRLFEECRKEGYIRGDLNSRSYAEARQAQGLSLIETNDFSALEVKKIANEAVRRYRRLSLLSHIKRPSKTLKTVVNQPALIAKFVMSLYSA